jgi:SWI/SNF-related matrix-associated actin-dependent regulator of chromatin subfamily A-like protein 1
MFDKSIFVIPEITIQGLKQFQIRGVKYNWAAHRCINAADTGCGKTIQAIATVEMGKLYPCIIVCSSGMKIQWASEIRKWLGSQVSISILSNESPDRYLSGYREDPLEGEADNFGKFKIPINKLDCEYLIVNYEIIYGWAKYLASMINPKMLIIDEAHAVKSTTTWQHKGCYIISKEMQKRNKFAHILALTRTPTINSPADLIGILKILGRLDDFGGWMNFIKRYCDLKYKKIKIRNPKTKKIEERSIKDYSGVSNLEELHKKLINTCLFSVNKHDVIKDLAPKKRTIISVPLSNRDYYNKVNLDFLEYVRETAFLNKEINQEINALSYIDLCNKVPDWFLAEICILAREERIKRMRVQLKKQHAAYKVLKARKTQALIKIGVLRQVISLGKIRAIVKHYNENGSKTLMFAHFQKTQQALIKMLPNAVYILGGNNQTIQERDISKNKFQKDSNCNICIVSQKAGGEGLNLTAAKNVYMVDIPQTARTVKQCEDRAFGRLSDPHGINSFIFVAEDTYDQRLLEIVDKKQSMASTIVDGKESEMFLDKNTNEDLFNILLKGF